MTDAQAFAAFLENRDLFRLLQKYWNDDYRITVSKRCIVDGITPKKRTVCTISGPYSKRKNDSMRSVKCYGTSPIEAVIKAIRKIEKD